MYTEPDCQKFFYNAITVAPDIEHFMAFACNTGCSISPRQIFPVFVGQCISFWCFTDLGTGIKGFDCLDEAAPIILKLQLLKLNHSRLGQGAP